MLQVGSPTAGNLTITAPITAPAGWHVLTLSSTGAISEQAGNSLTVADLRTSSSGPVTLDVASNAIQAFAASSTSSVSVVNGASLTIGTVDGVSGIFAGGGSAVNVTSSGTLSETGGGLVNTTGTLTTVSVGGTTLGGANAVGAFAATNTGSGAISLTDTAAGGMLLNNVSQSGGGNLTINNTGAIVLNGTSISAGAGTIDLITGGSLTSAGANNAVVASTLTGSAATGVTISDIMVGTLGPFTNTTSGNISIGSAQALATSGTVADTAAGGTLELFITNGGALTVGGPVTTSNGEITLLSDGMTLGGPVNAGTAAVTLEPFTAGRAIDVGTAPAGVLGLTQASLNEVTASVLRIGAPAAGNLTITAPISAPAGWHVLTLVNNGAISQQAGDSLTVSDLRISSAGPVALDVASNDIPTFAASVTSSVSLVDGVSLTIGSVDGVGGVSTAGGQIQVATKGSGAITINGPVASNGGEIDIAAAPGFGLTNTTTSIASGGGNIVLLGDTLALGGGAGSVNAVAGTIVLAPSTTSDNIILGAASSAGTLGLQTADFATITAGQVQIGYRNENGTTAGAFNIFVDGPEFNAGQIPSVLLVAGASGFVEEPSPLSFTPNGAGTLGIIAGHGVNLSFPNKVATLAGFTDGGSTASFAFVDNETLTVGALPSPTLGVAVASGTGLASSAAMATGAGLPTNPLSGITTANADVGLFAAAGDLILNGNIATGAGAEVSLFSANGSLDDAGANDVITAGTLIGGAGTGVSLGDPNLVGTLGPFTNTTSGNVIIGNGQSLATSGTISNAAPTGSLELIVFNGGALTVGGPVTTSNGFITLFADAMTLGGPVNAGTARVTLTPFDAGVAIALGTAPGGVLGLTQASLDEVTAGVLQIGSPTAGDLTITAPIAAPAGWNVLTLVSNGAISQQAGNSLTVPDLRTSSSGPVTLNVASNHVGAFAAASSSAVSLVNGANLLIATVDGVGGIFGSAVNLTSSGTISESGGSPINTSGALTTSSVGGQTLVSAGNVVGTFNATNTGSGNTALLDGSASGLLITGVSQSGGGNVSLNNTGGMTLSGTIGDFGAPCRWSPAARSTRPPAGRSLRPACLAVRSAARR